MKRIYTYDTKTQTKDTISIAEICERINGDHGFSEDLMVFPTLSDRDLFANKHEVE